MSFEIIVCLPLLTGRILVLEVGGRDPERVCQAVDATLGRRILAIGDSWLHVSVWLAVVFFTSMHLPSWLKASGLMLVSWTNA